MVRHNLFKNFLKIWHYHVEFELVSIIQSTGTRFIGDCIEKFEAGEVILIGKNLPHMWLNDAKYFNEDCELKAEAIAVHFRRDFLGTDFFKVPEMRHISVLLDRAQRGIKFEHLDADIRYKINDLITLESYERTSEFIDVLHKLAKHNRYRLLSSIGYVDTLYKTKDDRLDNIYEYIFKNFQNTISARDVSKVANMNPSAFSRFFKRTHRKTFTRYLNEIRIGYACKLLVEEYRNVAQACYDSGFNNISNFNKQFKEITGFSPTEYIKIHGHGQ